MWYNIEKIKMENKLQHFVPQFYFKLFSKDESHIFGYHLKRKLHYNGLISKQAAKNFFYGKNTEIEKSFSPIEGKINEVLTKLSNRGGLLFLDIFEYVELLRFISFQHKRTDHSKKLGEDFFDKMRDNILLPLMKSNKDLMSKNF